MSEHRADINYELPSTSSRPHLHDEHLSEVNESSSVFTSDSFRGKLEISHPASSDADQLLNTSAQRKNGGRESELSASSLSGGGQTKASDVTGRSLHLSTRPYNSVPMTGGEEETKCIVSTDNEVKQNICMGVALTVILGGGIIVGVILCALSSLGLAFQILGPTILGLSMFSLIYRLYMAFLWKEDPVFTTVTNMQLHFPCKMYKKSRYNSYPV